LPNCALTPTPFFMPLTAMPSVLQPITLKLIEDPHLLVALIADWLWWDKTRPDADLECPVENRE